MPKSSISSVSSNSSSSDDNNSRKKHDSDSDYSSSDEDENSDTDYSSSDDENKNDDNNDISFEEKNECIKEMFDVITSKKSIISDNIRYFDDGEWCMTKEFLHTSEDRLSTVGSGHLTDNRYINFIWKVCESWDYTILAEYNIMKRLEEMFEWNPHFVRAYEVVEMETHPSFSREPIKYVPFLYKYNKNNKIDIPKRKCKNHFLLMEELTGHLSVYDYLYLIEDFKDGKRINNIICSIIMQTLISIYNANKYCDFTHYDLHTSNVLMEDTDDMYRLYIGEDYEFLLRTHELSTVIIDTGYSYCDVLSKGVIDTCITNFTTGYTPIVSNLNHDFRTFLLNMVWDYPTHCSATSKMSSKLKDYANTYYKTSHIDMKTGWLKLNRDKIFVLKKYINDVTKLCSKKSIFYDSSINCFDVFTHIMKLPLKETDEKIDIKLHREKFMKFYNLFVRIENKCGSSLTFRKYIFKTIIHFYYKQIFSESGYSSTVFQSDIESLLNDYNITVTDFDYDAFYHSLLNYLTYYECAVSEAYRVIESQNKQDFLKVPQPVNIMNFIYELYDQDINLKIDDIVMVYDSVKKEKRSIIITDEIYQKLNILSTNKEKTQYLKNL